MKTFQKTMFGALSAALVFTGCGDDSGSEPDARTSPDAPVTTPDAPVTTPDAGTPDAPVPSYTPPAPIAVPLSPGGADQLQSAVAAPGGGFYAVGFRATGLTGEAATRQVIVVKLTAAGALDTTWSGDGIAEAGLTFIGGSNEIDIAIQQPDNKIIVSAAVPHATQAVPPGNPLNEDAAVARLNADGTIDTEFGDDGKRSLNLNVATGGNAGPRALAIDSMGRIYVHAVELQTRPIVPPATEPTKDADFAIVRLTPGGDIDPSFANGKFVIDIKGGTLQRPKSLGATVHALAVVADGVIGGGYVSGNEPFITGAQPVLYKVDFDGKPVDAFDRDGVFYDAVWPRQTEVYGFAVHGDHLVTGGYGRIPDEGTNDWVSMRFNATTGARDLTWGGAPGGAVPVVPSATLGDNCRNAVALPGGKTILVGSTGPMPQPMGSPPHASRDAAFAILDETGRLDAAYGAAPHAIKFGAGDGGDDQFWGAAATADTALLVGWKGTTVAPATAENNDDAYILVVPLK